LPHRPDRGAELGRAEPAKRAIALNSTSYYNQNRDALFEQYQAYDPAAVHHTWAEKHLKGTKPGFACDIGAGTGRDANWLAERGWEVLAVEPSKLREPGERSAHPKVDWLDDTLPELKRLRALGRRFDLILLCAVWMHVPQSARERAFRILSDLLNPAGLLVISLRHGSDEAENRARGFHPISAGELIEYARTRAITLKGQHNHPDRRRSHIRWEWLVFAMPDDGTGSLPLIRHVIVNDEKSSTYKLGLLRTLVRIAETAPGIVTARTDEYVEIPFGAVGLYWLKLYGPLVLHHSLPQRPSGPGQYGWAKEAFYRLVEFSLADLRLGATFTQERGNIIRAAINDACRNIEKMPANYITYPGSLGRQVFQCDFRTARKHAGPVVLSREYLASFGSFRIPARLWQTFSQFACWLDPVIVREWKQITAGWSGVADVGRNSDQAFEWDEARRDTAPAYLRAQELRQKGMPLTCTWSAEKIGTSLHIDHCFPWARWRNNDLWNLLPATEKVNLSKSDRLPSAETLTTARDRMIDWWNQAWIDGPREEQFLMEAIYSLPGLTRDRPSLDEIHQAARHQRARLRQDQQIAEWSVGM